DVVTLFLLVSGLLLLLEAQQTEDRTMLWYGYLWLLVGSGYFLIRCLLDLALVRRPALAPNLNLGGLAWLAAALFVCLIAVAVRRPVEPVGRESTPIREIKEASRRMVDSAVAEAAPGNAGSVDSGFWAARVLAILGHLAVVAALIVIGW